MYGVYVGMSKYSPAQRFDQHKAGIRAAGSVLKRGIEVLTGPTLHLQYIKRSEASRIEEELALERSRRRDCWSRAAIDIGAGASTKAHRYFYGSAFA